MSEAAPAPLSGPSVEDRHDDIEAPELPPPIPARPWLPWIALGTLVGALDGGATPAALARIGLHATPLVLWWSIGPLLLVGLVGAARRLPIAARWLAFAAACLCGAALVGPHREAVDVSRLMEVEGEVQDVYRTGWKQRLALSPEQVRFPERMVPPARLRVVAPGAAEARVGDRVRVRGATAVDERGSHLDAIEVERRQRREDGPRSWAWDAVGRMERRRELASSLLMGWGDPPERDAFRRSGLLHVLAVSGMHLAIAAALGTWLLRLAGLSWMARQVALALLIAGYTWLTGASPATQRALVMGLAMIVSGVVAREPHRLAAVSLATLALLVWHPADAGDIGFQLSVAAVLGIVTLGRELVELRARILPLTAWPLDRLLWHGVLFAARSTCDGLAIGVAAALASAPILAWHFRTANPWSPIATLAAGPPSTAALWLGLPLLGLGGLWPNGPWEGLYRTVEWSLDALVAVVDAAAALPGATLAVPMPSPWMLLAWPALFVPMPAQWSWAKLPAFALLLVVWRFA